MQLFLLNYLCLIFMWSGLLCNFLWIAEKPEFGFYVNLACNAIFGDLQSNLFLVFMKNGLLSKFLLIAENPVFGLMWIWHAIFLWTSEKPIFGFCVWSWPETSCWLMAEFGLICNFLRIAEKPVWFLCLKLACFAIFCKLLKNLLGWWLNLAWFAIFRELQENLSLVYEVACFTIFFVNWLKPVLGFCMKWPVAIFRELLKNLIGVSDWFRHIAIFL